jgi:hypothetical protein
MITTEMESVIHYRHVPEEVARLDRAIVPLMGSVRAVASSWDRNSLKRILSCEFFRAREAAAVKSMLLRAVKHCRASLGEYFPSMQRDVLIQAQALEDATKQYWAKFQRLREESLPIH